MALDDSVQGDHVFKRSKIPNKSASVAKAPADRVAKTASSQAWRTTSLLRLPCKYLPCERKTEGVAAIHAAIAL